MASPAPENHFEVWVMMSPTLKNVLLGAGNDITRS
jgi:hypothetical protein